MVHDRIPVYRNDVTSIVDLHESDIFPFKFLPTNRPYFGMSIRRYQVVKVHRDSRYRGKNLFTFTSPSLSSPHTEI